MIIVVPLCAFVLGSLVGGVGGILFGFVWYEHKCGLLSDHSGKRIAAIRFELDDDFARGRTISDDGLYAVARRKFARFMSH
jgi:hypothetical protein